MRNMPATILWEMNIIAVYHGSEQSEQEIIPKEDGGRSGGSCGCGQYPQWKLWSLSIWFLCPGQDGLTFSASVA